MNTATGTHPVDPYKAQNAEDPPLAEKVQDLVEFINQVKFGMLTTKQSEGDYLASRCMALAATVRPVPGPRHTHNHPSQATESIEILATRRQIITKLDKFRNTAGST